jgi:hypothetical protein
MPMTGKKIDPQSGLAQAIGAIATRIARESHRDYSINVTIRTLYETAKGGYNGTCTLSGTGYRARVFNLRMTAGTKKEPTGHVYLQARQERQS